MIHELKSFVLVALVAIGLTANLGLQAQEIADRATFDAIVAECGEVIQDELNFGGFVPNGEGFETGGPLPAPLIFDTAWGTIDYSALLIGVEDGSTPANFSLNGDVALSVFETPVSVIPDPANGNLEGVCIRYVSLSDTGALEVTLEDGSSIVLVLPVSQEFDGILTTDTIEQAEFCWINDTGQSITGVELSAVREVDSDDPGSFLAFGIDLAFGDGCSEVDLSEPEPATCFEQLAEVKACIDDLLVDATDSDAYFLYQAHDCVCWLQDDVFWQTDDRLTAYGGSFFVGAAYTIAYLEWTEDPASNEVIDKLIAVLECIVDNEIEYAIANDGHTSFIEAAEQYADLAEIIDDDFDNEVVAALAYRLSWLHAFYATY